jgi:transposase
VGKMGRVSSRPAIELSEKDLALLRRVAKSRTEEVRKAQRAKIILMNHDGYTDTQIKNELKIDINTVRLTLSKCLSAGVSVALNDLVRPGAPPEIVQEDKAWIIYLACNKPQDFGYAQETWTITLLQEHIRKEAGNTGHPRLQQLSRSNLWKILNDAEIKPHRINYYLERKDPDFEAKMEQVLLVYKEVNVAIESGAQDNMGKVTVSYDEKPGIQALGKIAPDLLPKPGIYPGTGRDYEYKRYGTVSLLAGINLMNGEITADVSETHKSSDFIRFLDRLDNRYALADKIRVILDNHSAHISKETMSYLASKPNRFEFVFTPKHGSWLNIIEGFFSKFTRVFLRNIRVASKQELKDRILQYISEVNANPVVIKWKYKMDEIIL